MYWFGHGINAGGYVVMVIGMMAFWGLLIYGVLTLVRRPGRSDLFDGASPMTPLRSPQQQLAARFADGEIDEDDYTHQLATLHRSVRP